MLKSSKTRFWVCISYINRLKSAPKAPKILGNFWPFNKKNPPCYGSIWNKGGGVIRITTDPFCDEPRITNSILLFITSSPQLISNRISYYHKSEVWSSKFLCTSNSGENVSALILESEIAPLTVPALIPSQWPWTEKSKMIIHALFQVFVAHNVHSSQWYSSSGLFIV